MLTLPELLAAPPPPPPPSLLASGFAAAAGSVLPSATDAVAIRTSKVRANVSEIANGIEKLVQTLV